MKVIIRPTKRKRCKIPALPDRIFYPAFFFAVFPLVLLWAACSVLVLGYFVFLHFLDVVPVWAARITAFKLPKVKVVWRLKTWDVTVPVNVHLVDPFEAVLLLEKLRKHKIKASYFGARLQARVSLRLLAKHLAIIDTLSHT